MEAQPWFGYFNLDLPVFVYVALFGPQRSCGLGLAMVGAEGPPLGRRLKGRP